MWLWSKALEFMWAAFSKKQYHYPKWKHSGHILCIFVFTIFTFWAITVSPVIFIQSSAVFLQAAVLLLAKLLLHPVSINFESVYFWKQMSQSHRSPER